MDVIRPTATFERSGGFGVSLVKVRATSPIMGRNKGGTLSRRQRQCMEGVAEHLDSAQIGERLGISPHTVDGHIAAAVAALGARSRRDAVRIWEESKTATAGEKLTGDFPPVDFPTMPPPTEHGSKVREIPTPMSFHEPLAQFDRRGGNGERPNRTLRVVAIVTGLAAALAILLLAAPQLGRDAQSLANLIQPYQQRQ